MATERRNQEAIEHIAGVVRVIKRQKHFSVAEYIAHERNEGKPLEVVAHETPRRNKRRKRAGLISNIEQRLYRTEWGKHLATQGQIHAAAKKMAQGGGKRG